MNKIESTDATPEQLLQLLDLQIAQARNQRRIVPRSRSSVLAGAILLILAGTVAALLVLQQMTTNRPSPEAASVAAQTVE